MKWQKGYEGCDTPWDLGWKHGTEEAGNEFARPKPGVYLTPEEYQEYLDGWNEARRGW